VSHQMIGACLFATLLCFTVFGLRDRHQTSLWMGDRPTPP
jgi:hypothetical protein